MNSPFHTVTSIFPLIIQLQQSKLKIDWIHKFITTNKEILLQSTEF